MALIAALRLARSFGNVEALARTIGSGGIVLLATGSSALDRTLLKVLGLVTDGGSWPGWADVPVLLRAADAVRSTGVSETDTVFGALSDRARDAVERGASLVLVAPVAGIAPRAVRDLLPTIRPLAPLDRPILAALLEVIYPGQEGAAAITALPQDAVLSRLGPDRIMLALRAADAVAAVRAFADHLTPVHSDGLGLAAFPLPAAVRAAIDRLVADLGDWQAGRLPWRDVSRGLLIVGPPGAGKTQIVRLIAQEAGVAVVAGSLATWSADGARGSEVLKAMRTAFERAGELAPCIIFIDELDAFGDRGRKADHNTAYTDYIVTALLDALDGFHAQEGVVFMGATNHGAKVDRAIMRPGRFDRVVTLDHPGPDLLPAALRWHLAGDLPDADLPAMVRSAGGASGADVAATVRAARARARAQRRAMTEEDLRHAFDDTCPPLPLAVRRRIAVHEAGHAIVAAATGCAVPRILAIRTGGGVAQSVPRPDREDRAALERFLAHDLAGRAAERLAFGAPSAGAGGDHDSDLAQATRLALAMEASLGLGPSLVWQGTPAMLVGQLQQDRDLRDRVERQLRQAEEEALRILTRHRALLDDMSAALMEAWHLSGAALDAFLGRVVVPEDVSERSEGGCDV